MIAKDDNKEEILNLMDEKIEFLINNVSNFFYY